MAETGKTSTFVLHHDRCDPSKWTVNEWRSLAQFARYGTLQEAAKLSACGLQLVLSDKFVPTGGTLEEVGFVKPGDPEISEIDEMNHDGEVFAVQRSYLGPVEYVVPIPMGDGDGCFDGYDFKFLPTKAEADAYLAGLRSEVTAEPAE